MPKPISVPGTTTRGMKVREEGQQGSFSMLSLALSVADARLAGFICLALCTSLIPQASQAAWGWLIVQITLLLSLK